MNLELVPFEIKSRIWILQVKMGSPQRNIYFGHRCVPAERYLCAYYFGGKS